MQKIKKEFLVRFDPELVKSMDAIRKAEKLGSRNKFLFTLAQQYIDNVQRKKLEELENKKEK